jgi:hypothetical protein
MFALDAVIADYKRHFSRPLAETGSIYQGSGDRPGAGLIKLARSLAL